MIKKRLGVNIDHVATIRNARGENYPDPLRAALLAQKVGAHSITIHLREDRRHIKDSDLKNIKKKQKIKEIFKGKENEFSVAVSLNAAAGLIVAEKTSNFNDAYNRTRNQLLSGKVYDHLIKITKF